MSAENPQHTPASELEAREVAEAAREKKWGEAELREGDSSTAGSPWI